MQTTTLKPRKSRPGRCKHCKVRFSPEDACKRLHDECIEPWTVAFREKQKKKAIAARKKAKREERKADVPRKEALKTIPDLIKEAQREFNKWVRERDEKQPCISCGAPPPDLSGLHAGRDAGHWRSTGAAAHLRFNEDNCHAQCVKCNQYKAGNAVEYRIGLVARIGAGRVEALEMDSATRKWTREELIEIKKTYAAKCRELRREKE